MSNPEGEQRQPITSDAMTNLLLSQPVESLPVHIRRQLLLAEGYSSLLRTGPGNFLGSTTLPSATSSSRPNVEAVVDSSLDLSLLLQESIGDRQARLLREYYANELTTLLAAVNTGNQLGFRRAQPSQVASTPAPAAAVVRVSQGASPTTQLSHEQIARTLFTLGSTLRTKADGYMDVTKMPLDNALCSHGFSGKQTFPEKLYRMLEEASDKGLDAIISFLPHGRAFRAHEQDRFVEEVLPSYFTGQKKWSSFARQLQLWGFRRINSGEDEGAYYHELFLRGKKQYCYYMRRVGAPTGVDRRRNKAPEGEDPDFCRLDPME